VQTNAALADVVVGLREHRDGLVETPEQLRFAARVLGLPDTADCNPLCDAQVPSWALLLRPWMLFSRRLTSPCPHVLRRLCACVTCRKRSTR
jgi:hypothetical protein